MWSYCLTAPGTLSEVRIAEPDANLLDDGQVVVRLEAGGLCGSDYTYFKGGQVPAVKTADPSSYGAAVSGASLHEIVGEVVVSRHLDIGVGQRVVGWATEMNGLSEYVVTAGDSLHAYSADLPAELAVTIQPLACVMYAVRRLTATSGLSAAVLGLGPIGLLFTHVLKTSGAYVVGVDRVDRKAVARVFGVDEFVHQSCDRWAAGLTASARPNLVIEAIGHQVTTLAAALEAVAPMGEVYYFGIPDDSIYPISMLNMLRKDLTLRSGATWDRPNSMARAEAYLQSYPELLKFYVTHIFPRQRSQEAFEAAIRPSPGQLKVVIKV